jgi:hypothetical protein
MSAKKFPDGPCGQKSHHPCGGKVLVAGLPVLKKPISSNILGGLP